MNALITVSDKTNIDYLARELNNLNITIMSTGGTFKEISKLNIPVSSVEDYTKAKEILSGRVKTLHPKIHGGILAIKDNKQHITELKEHNIKSIDIIVVNLYPFEKVIQKENIKLNEAIENIDIGGVALMRAAAKNFQYTTIISDPEDYYKIIEELKNKKNISLNTRYELALKAFKKTAGYDSAIHDFLRKNK